MADKETVQGSERDGGKLEFVLSRVQAIGQQVKLAVTAIARKSEMFVKAILSFIGSVVILIKPLSMLSNQHTADT